MDRARFAGFYRRSIAERVHALGERGWLDAQSQDLLLTGAPLLPVEAADKMVENVIGVFGMPLGLGLNFLINGAEYVVPLVVEEPSIVAALSAAAKLVRSAGGFVATSDESLLIGQIHVADVPDSAAAVAAIVDNKKQLMDLANSFIPNMVTRGGGVRDVQTRLLELPEGRGSLLVVHLLVDTCDAMGANAVNTVCEAASGRIQELTCGRPLMCILSNLTDRSMVTARCSIDTKYLAQGDRDGTCVRDAIVLANDAALVCPYRAATHNKGIMNGIDAVALATGNDWRAIEASAHAYAGRGVGYVALTQWRVGPDGALEGTLRLPLKVGVVGGNFKANPGVSLGHALLGHVGAQTLAHVMASVGLAQNFSALKALVTGGIQEGHMALHARSVAASAGAPPHLVEAVVARVLASGDIKQWRAEEIVAALIGGAAPTQTAAGHLPTPRNKSAAKKLPEPQAMGVGVGKVLLAGEHAVVYGSHALAVPIPLATRASVHQAQTPGVHLLIPAWGAAGVLDHSRPHNFLHRSLHLMLQRLGLTGEDIVITVHADVPRAMGLGGSAALAVSVVRALSVYFDLDLADDAVADLAFEAEKVAHGNPSGVDNALATLGRPLLFRRGEPPSIRAVAVQKDISLVVGLSGSESLTAKTVSQVRLAWTRHTKRYEGLFKDIDSLALEAAGALQSGDLTLLGELMNINHGLLNALQVSTPALEEMVALCRRRGALGVKLTGGGGGGSMVALAPEQPEGIALALQEAGYRAFVMKVGAVSAAPLDLTR